MSDYYNVKTHFGAIGNGIADDSMPISHALTAMATHHLPVLFPAGTYLINSTLTMPSCTYGELRGENATIRFQSTVQAGLVLAAPSSQIRIEGLTFQGDSSDDKTVNFNAAIVMSDGVTDLTITRCVFDHCNPVESYDSYTTARLHFLRNYCHNCSGGIHPPNDSIIDDNDFICDTIVGGSHGRAQAIYCYGSFEKVMITNNRFKNIAEEDIQVRSSNSRFQQKNNFLIADNYFENSNMYSIWVGSDEKSDNGCFTIRGNHFKNCGTPVQSQGANSVIVADNHMEWDWECPFAGGPGAAINVLGGIGGAGRYSQANGPIIANNKLIQRHPFFTTITVGTIDPVTLAKTAPANGDTLTVGDFTYTWKTAPSVEGDIQLNTVANPTLADPVSCAANLVMTLQGQDGLMTAPCNVLRGLTDAFHDEYAASRGLTNGNVVIVASHSTFAAPSGSASMAFTAVTDARQAAGSANSILVQACINPLIEGNVADDLFQGIYVTQNFAPTVRNNVHSSDGPTPQNLILGYGNVFSQYSGNRWVTKQPLIASRANGSVISDGFPVVEDAYPIDQQLTTQALQGRSGLVPIGDGKAYTYLYYGYEIAADTSSATRRYRWDDGDEVTLNDGLGNVFLFDFKRSSPGATQFNTADGLITLINATGFFSAAYADIINTLAATNPKQMIRIWYTAAGLPGNGAILSCLRYGNPAHLAYPFRTPAVSAGAIGSRTPHSLLCGITLVNRMTGDTYATFNGGVPIVGSVPTLTKTYVMSPIANPSRGVSVSGVDATSAALAPIVYQADIIPGVGFVITHGAGAGTEQFYYRVD